MTAQVEQWQKGRGPAAGREDARMMLQLSGHHLVQWGRMPGWWSWSHLGHGQAGTWQGALNLKSLCTNSTCCWFAHIGVSLTFQGLQQLKGARSDLDANSARMKQYIVARLEWSMTENALITFNSIDAVKKKTFNSSQNRTKEASIHRLVLFLLCSS